MPFVDLFPQWVASAGGWLNPTAILANDGNLATHVSGSVHYPIYAYNLLSGIPLDTKITGIQIIAKASVTGGVGTPILTCSLFADSNFTALGSSFSSTTLNSSSLTYTIGSSANTWGLVLSHPVYRSETFGVSILPSGDTVPFNIDYVAIRIFYTPFNYLVGSRSIFTLDPNTPLDVNQANDSLSIIPQKFNNVSNSSQIKSDDVNSLGDALYNIETALLNQPISVKGIGNSSQGNTYVFTLTLSGIVNGSGNEISYSSYKNNGATGTNLVRLSSELRTKLPKIPGPMNCYFTGAIGWMVSGGVTTPLFVKSNGLFFTPKTDGTNDFWISIAAINQSIASSLTDAESLASTTSAYQGYIGSIMSLSPIPSGTIIYLKMLAIAKGT